MAASAVTNFLVNDDNLNELFPGIDFRFVTLNGNVFMPIVREHILPLVGEPIEVPKVENPSQELIDEYHEKFFSALATLFEKYKEEYDIHGKESELSAPVVENDALELQAKYHRSAAG
ncbi:hypothetical protein V9T40_010744 [Parthenolecanium corni]|uniref:Uncharacterized protein n=1 Tax=Parthenolecanium corni TaxID=536013 RepID=A0AAN9XYT4_9HEMI